MKKPLINIPDFENLSRGEREILPILFLEKARLPLLTESENVVY
jgi:hypothetical protein